MDVNSALQNLINAISVTKEYADLQSAKREVSMNPEAAGMLNQFQQKQEYLNNPNLAPDQAQSMYNSLNSEYARLNNIPVLAKYFNAANNLGSLIENIVNSIYGALSK